MTKIALRGGVKSLDEIVNWYEDELEALKILRSRILADAINLTHSIPNSYSKFLSFTIDEIDEYFSNHEKELEHLVCFDLIAATEGLLRSDYLDKCRKKSKSSIGRAFRNIYKVKEERVSLEEDIIKVWKQDTSASYFGDLIGLLKYRHWLAHGRYWTPKLGRQYTFDDAYYIVNNVSLIVEAND